MARWQNGDITVTLEFVPRYFYLTASANVYLDDFCLLKTGGVMRSAGANRASFRYGGEDHVVELSWRVPPRGLDLSYQLSIDGQLVADSTVRPRNAILMLLPIAGIIAIVVGLILLGNFIAGKWP